ncbi:endo-1,4-beta-xylanase [Dictyobacter aurantiacus]|uniref:Beta-xylanase n=1 Tax=Dictyobacter aurantiacus TaxID=1936993 RepID=A0A401ZGU3_9CHLR|nr:endo-1,4-beta-xylanase [Dictyobacter aurantiacus]GCE06087.1 beta-xylanase [Dictyobacter aurantiacus]
MQLKRFLLAISLILLLLFSTGCTFIPQADENKAVDPTPMPAQTQPGKEKVPFQDIHTLRDAALYSQKRTISIGTAANIDAFHADTTYQTIMGREFNILVAENVMKMYVTHPDIDTFNFIQSDELVNFARQHGMQIEGANLIWSNQVPAWITNGGYTRDELLGIMKDYITNVVGHYKGQIQSWIVVNEPLDTDELNQQSIWERIIGPQYIDYAFRWAHEADPQARLYINEFNTELVNEKSNRYYALTQSLVQRKVPINGIGFEGHLDITLQYPYAQLVANMKRFANLGLQVQITEADIKLQNSPHTLPEKFTQQATLYAELIHACQDIKQCTGVILWGFTDRYTWIPNFTHHPDQPLIFDNQYQPKPAYTAIKKALYGT